jgi:hypothetical protein
VGFFSKKFALCLANDKKGSIFAAAKAGSQNGLRVEAKSSLSD